MFHQNPDKLKVAQGQSVGEFAEKAVIEVFKNQLSAKFQASVPCFILHNVDLPGKSEADIVILHETIGIVICEVKATQGKLEKKLKKAESQLKDARTHLEKKLNGILGQSAITLVAAFPNASKDDGQKISVRLFARSQKEYICEAIT